MEGERLRCRGGLAGSDQSDQSIQSIPSTKTQQQGFGAAALQGVRVEGIEPGAAWWWLICRLDLVRKIKTKFILANEEVVS